MSTTVIILLIVPGIITLLLIIAAFMKKEHSVRCEIIIYAPLQKVFDYLKLLKNQDQFNKNAMADTGRNNEYIGIDGTVGFVHSWSGNKKAGEGVKEIKKIVEGKIIETEIRFTKPMKAVGHMIMETTALSGDQTKVSWSNAGPLPYPLNIMIPMIEKHVAKDMDNSLLTLKSILENGHTN